MTSLILRRLEVLFDNWNVASFWIKCSVCFYYLLFISWLKFPQILLISKECLPDLRNYSLMANGQLFLLYLHLKNTNSCFMTIDVFMDGTKYWQYRSSFIVLQILHYLSHLVFWEYFRSSCRDINYIALF